MLFSLVRLNKTQNQWTILCMMRSYMTCSLKPMPLPSQREIHLWYITPDEINNGCMLNQYQDLLSPLEKDGVLRMNGNKLQKGALLARILVRTTISRYTNCKFSPESLNFKRNRFGKPVVDWGDNKEWFCPDLHFNISHTPSLIACGVTVGINIGVDIEEKHRQLKNNVLSFARRYFTPHEVDFLHAMSDPERQRQEFIKLWTLKESYVKALGRGFSAAPFRDFMIQFRQCKDKNNNMIADTIIKPCADSEFLTTNWEFALFELARTHYAAICIGEEAIVPDRQEDKEEKKPIKLQVWKTIPFVEDVDVSSTDQIVPISGLS